MDELVALRRGGILALLGAAWGCVVCIVVCCFWSTQGWAPALIALLVSIAPTALALSGRTDVMVRIAFGATMPLYPAILLFQWSGSPWQVDIHMLFFALIAMLAILADWRPIVVSAAVTAVHHLLTNFLMPSLVFPGGADFGRVILHAVIVIIETGALVWLAIRFESLVLEQARNRTERDKVEEEAADERARIAAEQDLMIRSIGSALTALSEGHLDHQIADSFPPSYEQLRQDFNQASAHLCTMMRSVSEAAYGINSGSSEIRTASDDLAVRTEQQAASLEETAAAMSDVTTMVRETARNAAEVSKTISETHREANAGGEVVTRTVTAMTAIEKSSQEIAQITNVIDGIAFQTNLLALNAGVEAARAGDAGRGFAVVASEVRALAQRSADAAKDIKELIAKSGTQVKQGVSLVNETGTMLGSIVQRVGEISERIVEISQSAETQSANLQHVNNAVGGMDQMTQQNAAMVEESTAAARSLATEAHDLTALVAKFHTGSAVVGGKVATRVPAARARSRASAPATRGNLALKTTPSTDEDWTEF